MMLLRHTHTHTKKKISKISEGLSSSFDLDTNLSSPKFLSGLYPASGNVNFGLQYLFRTILKIYKHRQSYCTLLAFCCCFKRQHLLQRTDFSRHLPSVFQPRTAEDPDHTLTVIAIYNTRAGRFQALLGRQKWGAA